MAKQNYAEFKGTQYVAGPEKPLYTRVLSTPIDLLTDKLKAIIVEEEEVEFDPQVGVALVKALRRAALLKSRGNVIDCISITTLLCGGVCLDKPRGATADTKLDFELTHGPLTEVAESSTEPMIPMILGKRGQDGSMASVHAHACVLPEKGLWLEKFGTYDFYALSRLDEVAAFYETDCTAQMFVAKKWCGSQPVISYTSSIPEGLETVTVRAETIS